eukprot:758882-Hanusia_phi.AAC.6
MARQKGNETSSSGGADGSTCTEAVKDSDMKLDVQFDSSEVSVPCETNPSEDTTSSLSTYYGMGQDKSSTESLQSSSPRSGDS